MSRSAEDLIDEVIAAVIEGDLASARRRLLKARRTARNDQLRGAIGGLEVACLRRDDEDDDRWRERFRALATDTSDDPIEFANAVGCTLSEVGEGLRDVRFLELADDWFTRVTTDASDSLLFANHAVVLDRMERYAAAAVAFGKALEVDATFHDARCRMARCLAKANDLAAAAREYRTYLVACPDDAHEWISLAIVECDAGNMEEAERAYWRAAGLEPDNLSLHYNWLISAVRAKDEERAAYGLKKLEAISPDDWRTKLARAHLLDRRGEILEAFRIAREAFFEVADEGDEEVLEDIAGKLLHLGRYPEARDEALRLVDDAFAVLAFPESLLDLIRELDDPERRQLTDFSVIVDSLYVLPDDSYGCIVNYRVFATDPDEASRLATAFHLRCGARNAHADKCQEEDSPPNHHHRGVRWRSDEWRYPADQYAPRNGQGD